MGKIFCIMGKSATGKDSVYRKLCERKELSLKKVVPYTTRPIREGEENGREYFFCSKEEAKRLEEEGRIIEQREYHTVYGVWKYFTAEDGQIQLEKNSYLLIGTLETYQKIRDYYGEDCVIPIYIEVEDGERLMRAIAREKRQKQPGYEELCRRFLADAQDFSEEKLKQAGISRRFVNEELEKTAAEAAEYIQSMR